MLRRVTEFASTHPLASALILAALIRVPAVIWSQGFIHSDDYYDTVMIAQDWLIDGHWGDDGYLRWRQEPSENIGRFPLYTMFLWFLLKIQYVLGIKSAGSMMYLVRGVHAAISLLPVWAAFRVVRITTDRNDWAFWSALAVGFHFGMPFLGVRTLIEMVGGSIWVASLALMYKHFDSRQDRWLLWAGILTGLAWMVRFQIAFAAIPVPFLLWLETRRLRSAVVYSVGVVIMLVASGFVDLALLGRFAGSTITNLTINTGLGAVYETVTGMYVALLLGLLIPPLSLALLYLALRPSFWKNHLTLVGSTAFFVLAHSLHANQQERFMFPILPAAFLIGALALWQKYRDDGYILRWRRTFKATAIIAVTINIVLLTILTPAYGHRGLIEPMKYLREQGSDFRVLFVKPRVRKFIPWRYYSDDLVRHSVREWKDLEPLRSGEINMEFDYVVLYPRGEDDLNAYLDSARTVIDGALVPVREFKPSFYDELLHRMNPNHNPDYHSYLYRVER